ncbi:DUF4281 domain-containing protein [Streptomyces durbertensis]|uniref:DUF4281 domain-containing protein n=1 Tax=Streptomyces durbertensis TaxID=2448886 RepID=A0ABR6EN02_9ACTN|nr:abscisic acid-deficient protein Aba4 family protein [Streptomyces durbertensis]MBB1246727.1 DUF4281 domain-containing protein [Streptomyces durbertensis]
MTDTLFGLAFALAAPTWALLIFAPGWRWTDRVAASVLPIVPIVLVYMALALPVLPELWEAVRRPDLAAFQRFTALDGGAAAIWAQVIAWDLFIGQWMYREGCRLRIHPLLMGPVLLLSTLLSPIGVLLFLAIRAFAQVHPNRPTGPPLIRRPGPGPHAPPPAEARSTGS